MEEIKEFLRYKYDEPRLVYSSDENSFNLIPTFTLTLIGIAGKWCIKLVKKNSAQRQERTCIDYFDLIIAF